MAYYSPTTGTLTDTGKHVAGVQPVSFDDPFAERAKPVPQRRDLTTSRNDSLQTYAYLRPRQ